MERGFSRMTRLFGRVVAFLVAALLLLPELVRAAGGGAEMLVVVADTRRVSWSVTKFFLDLYNTDPTMFGVLCVVFTAGLGCALGLITDFIMKRTGIDLTSRKIVEH
jgi:hypothetical protein